ncbi:hypothetical protein ACXJJ3_06735 [Kribbella sp. WER1]
MVSEQTVDLWVVSKQATGTWVVNKPTAGSSPEHRHLASGRGINSSRRVSSLVRRLTDNH